MGEVERRTPRSGGSWTEEYHEYGNGPELRIALAENYWQRTAVKAR
ncbi:hypothetical protein N9L68_08570 [bacterium]|nr:hypothetical protein [bacterium]